MKKIWIVSGWLLAAISGVYGLLLILSLFHDYLNGDFAYWGYPQWGWMYASVQNYLLTTAIFLLVIIACLTVGVFFLRRYPAVSCGILLLPILGMFYFGAFYGSQTEKTAFDAHSSGRIPEGLWIVDVDNLQEYASASFVDKILAPLYRGNWPGGTSVWGEYRIWLTAANDETTQGRKGWVLFGDAKHETAWGIAIPDDMAGFVAMLKDRGVPIALTVDYKD